MEVLISFMLLLMALYVIITILIYNFLRIRNVRTNFLLLRMFAISNALKYKKITKEKTAKVGFLFYQWRSTVNLALLSFIINVLVKTI